MKPDKLIPAISSAYTVDRVEELKRRANLTPMSPTDRAAVKRAADDRLLYLNGPLHKQALARTR